jgi:RNase P/RNase MRP subunit POP5
MGIVLIRFNGKEGIIKCNHTQKDNTIMLLNSINDVNLNKINITTLGTSGTIKSLIKKQMSDNLKKNL